MVTDTKKRAEKRKRKSLEWKRSRCRGKRYG